MQNEGREHRTAFKLQHSTDPVLFFVFFSFPCGPDRIVSHEHMSRKKNHMQLNILRYVKIKSDMDWISANASSICVDRSDILCAGY